MINPFKNDYSSPAHAVCKEGIWTKAEDATRPSGLTIQTCSPSLAVVGWIPFFADLADMGPNNFKLHRFSQRSKYLPFGPAAFSVLFKSGNVSVPGMDNNPNPDVFLAGRGNFGKLIESKNYRAVFSIGNVRVGRDTKWDPLDVCFDCYAASGYTPFRIPIASRLFGEHFSKGREYFDYDVTTHNSESVVLDFVLRFKVAWIADIGCAFLNGKRAPWAWLRVRYEVGTRNARVNLEATCIPSQSRYYPDGEKWGLYDMLSAETPEIDGFLAAGCWNEQEENWNDAPKALNSCWSQSVSVTNTMAKCPAIIVPKYPLV
jgi:hypothetical protein